MLKLEGLGFSPLETVKFLSEKYSCAKQSVYRDYALRSAWQPILTQTKDASKHVQKTLNRFEQIYREAAFRYKTANPENPVSVGYLKIMLETTSRLADLFDYKPEFTPDAIELRWLEPQVEIDSTSLTEDEKSILNQASRILIQHQKTKESLH